MKLLPLIKQSKDKRRPAESLDTKTPSQLDESVKKIKQKVVDSLKKQFIGTEVQFFTGSPSVIYDVKFNVGSYWFYTSRLPQYQPLIKRTMGIEQIQKMLKDYYNIEKGNAYFVSRDHLLKNKK